MRNRLELVRVAFGALNRQTEQRRGRDLHRPFDGVIPVGAHLVRIAVAFTRPVLAVPQKMCCDQGIDDIFGNRHVGSPADQFITSQLFSHESIEGLVGVDRADHVIAIPVCQRPVAVRIEVTIRIGVASGVEPHLSDPFPIVRRSEIPIDQTLHSVR